MQQPLPRQVKAILLTQSNLPNVLVDIIVAYSPGVYYINSESPDIIPPVRLLNYKTKGKYKKFGVCTKQGNYPLYVTIPNYTELTPRPSMLTYSTYDIKISKAQESFFFKLERPLVKILEGKYSKFKLIGLYTNRGKLKVTGLTKPNQIYDNVHLRELVVVGPMVYFIYCIVPQSQCD